MINDNYDSNNGEDNDNNSRGDKANSNDNGVLYVSGGDVD